MADPAMLAERAKRTGGGEQVEERDGGSLADRLAPLGAARGAFVRIGGGVADAGRTMGGMQRGRWRLREVDGGRTRVELRFAYGVAGSGVVGYVSERVAAPSLRRNMRRTLAELRRQVEHQRLGDDDDARRAERQSASA